MLNSPSLSTASVRSLKGEISHDEDQAIRCSRHHYCPEDTLLVEARLAGQPLTVELEANQRGSCLVAGGRGYYLHKSVAPKACEI